MTVPDEHRPHTAATDPAARRPDEAQGRGGTGRTLREALEEAQVRPDDFTEREGNQA
ncbi:hypothetical protein ACFVYF_24265 [Streptomyces sp. NPDC058274]|jgi:hypothetical protein|uniref:hypothetical protein n=1 Tax=Streptomyces sp. NPDC058274 TaxID=3346416 RepID=UPI0036EDC4AD